MKRLLMRFFEKKKNVIPDDSIVVCSDNSSKEKQIEILSADMDVAINWINKHPKGKVDLIWGL